MVDNNTQQAPPGGVFAVAKEEQVMAEVGNQQATDYAEG